MTKYRIALIDKILSEDLLFLLDGGTIYAY